MHIEPDTVCEQPAESLENAAVEMLVVALVEEFPQQRHAEHETGPFDMPIGEVFPERVERADVGDEHHLADGGEQVDTGQEIGIFRGAAIPQVVHGDLHDLAYLARLAGRSAGGLAAGGLCRVGLEDHAGAVHHLEVQFSHRRKPSAFDQHPCFPDRLRGQQRRAVHVEEERRREADPHQMQAQQPVVDAAEGRSAHVDPVDLQPLAADGIEQTFNQGPWILPVVKGCIGQVYAQPAHRFLLQGVGGVEHPHVEKNVAGRRPHGMLEPQAHPGVALVATLERAGRRGVGKDEEPRPVAPHAVEPFVQEHILMVEHLLDSFPRDIPLRLAVDGVADGHVVGGDRLRHRACRAAHGEEPAGHLLAGADLGEVAIDRVVEIDGDGPLGRRIDCLRGGGSRE